MSAVSATMQYMQSVSLYDNFSFLFFALAIPIWYYAVVVVLADLLQVCVGMWGK